MRISTANRPFGQGIVFDENRAINIDVTLGYLFQGAIAVKRDLNLQTMV
jgi:hypothetical protein